MNNNKQSPNHIYWNRIQMDSVPKYNYDNCFISPPPLQSEFVESLYIYTHVSECIYLIPLFKNKYAEIVCKVIL